MSKRGGNDPKKPPEEEEWKKKKKFDEDPIVKRYTTGANYAYKGRSEEEFRKKKKSNEPIDKKAVTDLGTGYRGADSMGYGGSDSKEKADDYKKTKKQNVSGIMEDMFGAKKDTDPFGNVQYTDNTKHIQRGEHHRHRRTSGSGRGHSGHHSGQRKKEHADVSPASSAKTDESPSFEKKKKKFDQNELFKKKETKAPSPHRKADYESISVKVEISGKSHDRKKKKADHDREEFKKKKEKKAKRVAAEKDDSRVESQAASAAERSMPVGSLPDYEKKKKKDLLADHASQGTGMGGVSPDSDRPEEEEEYDHKKKKDYEYETLFGQKTDTGTTNDTRLRQAYQASQAYRSVSTSGSRTSLSDVGSADVQSAGSPTGSQLGTETSKKKKKESSVSVKTTKKTKSSVSDAAKKSGGDDVFARLKIDKSKAAERVNRYKAEKDSYPVNYYKQIHKYFDLKPDTKVEEGDYEKLGKLMEDELLAAKVIRSSDDDEFLKYLNIRSDEFSKKKRIKNFEENLKPKYNDKLSSAENEPIIRAYFDLKSEKLTPNQLERLDKIMREELLSKKLAISDDWETKEKRLNEHPNVADKQAKDLSPDDVINFYGLEKQSTTQIELNLLYDLLKNELIDAKVADYEKSMLAEKKIPTDEASRQERYNRFKTDLLVNYEVGNVKYFVGKYFGKRPEEISDEDLRALSNVIRHEVTREMAKESEEEQEKLQRALNLIDDEVKIIKEDKDFEDSPIKVRTDKAAVAERLKRFHDIILPDYKSGLKKLNYRDRIATYFGINANNCSPAELEELGHRMDKELKEAGVKFIDTDDQFLQDKNVDLNESKRNDRVKRHSKDAEKIQEDLKSLAAKKLLREYYEFDPNRLNDEELLHFSTMMVDEILNPRGDGQPMPSKLEPAKQVLVEKGIDLSPAEQEKRRLKFKNEIEPEVKSHVKKLDYSYMVAKYFGFGDTSNLSPDEIARLKRLMDREIVLHDREPLGKKYKISFEPNATNDRLKRFADSIEPDYRNKLKKLNYQDRIQLYFNLKPNQAINEDLEILGKVMEDELLKVGVQFPTDNDLFLADLNIPIEPADKKKRLLKLKNELERNPIDCTNPSYLLKIYFDLKDMKALNDKMLPRLAKIMEEEQLEKNGDLVANQLKGSTPEGQLIAMLNQLALRDSDQLKKGVYRLVLYDADGRKVDEYSFKLKDKKYLNDEVLRLEKENAAKINEMKQMIEEKLKNDQEDKTLIEGMKKDLEKEIKQQSLLKIDIQKSGIDDREEQEKLLEKLAQQKRNLEEQRNARIKEEAEKLRKETEEKYKQQLENLDEEERQKELRELEELERSKKEMMSKRKQEHQERKKRLQEEAERAKLENQKKLDQHAKEYDEELRKQLDEEKAKLDEEYQKIRKANKELAEKLKKEFEAERAKIETNLMVMETKIKEIRAADEEDRKNKLLAKAKELEEINTKKLKDEAQHLETEAKEEIKQISARLEEEMNSPDKKGHPNIEAETNRKRAKLVDALNETNRKKLDDLAKKMEAEAMVTLDETAKKLDEEAKKRLEKQLEESRKEHEQQLAKLKEALHKLMNSKK